MADNIDKYTAINSNDGTNPIKGDIIASKHQQTGNQTVFVLQVLTVAIVLTSARLLSISTEQLWRTSMTEETISTELC